MLMIRQKSNLPSDGELDQPIVHGCQRNDERIISQAPLVISLFSTRFHREFASMTFNHSKNGLCFEAAEPFKPGVVLFIRLGNAPADQSNRGDWKYLRTTTLAEVKWCHELKDKFGSYYRIGVKYY